MLWNSQARWLRQCCANTPVASLRWQCAARGPDAAVVMKLSYIMQCFPSRHLTTRGRGSALCTDWPRYTAEWKNAVKAAEMTLCFWSGFNLNCKWKSAVCRHVSTAGLSGCPKHFSDGDDLAEVLQPTLSEPHLDEVNSQVGNMLLCPVLLLRPLVHQYCNNVVETQKLLLSNGAHLLHGRQSARSVS